MLKEFYADMDDVNIDTIMDDIEFIRQICPMAKYKVYRSSPNKKNYHLIIFNVNIPFHLALDILSRIHTDASYIAVVRDKRNFFIRSSARYESDGKKTSEPVLIMEG